jgi:RelA/SpoT family (p)ppGpp synthetase
MVASKNGKYKKKLEELLSICKKNLRSVDTALIERAYYFSLEAHKNDIRASGEPFFDHPYEVAMIIAREIPLDDFSVASALLHDVAEDTEFTIDDIRAEFGPIVADIVDGATKITDIFKSHEITEAENYRKLLLSMVNDIRVMLVKFADRLHNMRTLEYLPVEKQQRLAKETLEIYVPFAHRFGLGKIKWELEDLSFKYNDRKEYDEISRLLNAKRREREHYIKKFVRPIEERLRAEGRQFEIGGRPKHLYSIYSKMQQRNKPLDEIYDLFAVRVILDTDNNNDCFAVYGVVSEIYIPIPERFKNYISIPKKNGYQSIHTTVVGPEGKMVEVQIRTRAMHEVAEKGVAAHWRYKENVTTLDKELEDWVDWVREMFDHKLDEDSPKELMESFKLNLYQDEIYVFTPKGELKILPKGSTPIDFAYEIHSQVGNHTIGAKVNGRIVPLNSLLKSGDQVEIITSKNQTPKADWEQFAVTHKAKSHLRRWIKEEQRKQSAEGREIWEKKLKKIRLHINEDDFMNFVHDAKYNNLMDFYIAIAKGEVNIDAFADEIELKLHHPQPLETEKETVEKTSIFKQFVKTARSSLGGILVTGSGDMFLHNFAKCCNPVPGDEIVGFVTTGEGIKIHRKTCHNAERLVESNEDRIIEVSWPVTDEQVFIAGIRLSGDDRTGMLEDITHAISTYNNTNIRSVNIDSKGTMFDGWILLYVKNLDHLNQIITRVKKLPGIENVERFEKL